MSKFKVLLLRRTREWFVSLELFLVASEISMLELFVFQLFVVPLNLFFQTLQFSLADSWHLLQDLNESIIVFISVGQRRPIGFDSSSREFYRGNLGTTDNWTLFNDVVAL
mmetsp:Transcript_24181/g.37190  ORF Transcript_24181/g.37190 Transcript_24181/m.37190 type:complete len:110 (-) Transcript_24181:3913-4242(-)